MQILAKDDLQGFYIMWK